MPQDPSLAPRPSALHTAWEKALHGGDAALLEHLASSDDPAAARLELETYINGLYRASQHPLSSIPMPDLRFEVRRVLPYAEQIRTRLGWRIRDFDLGLLRLIRRSSALSPALGAGVSMGAGAPSWSELVRLRLEETLDKDLEFYGSVPAANNPAQPPTEFLPDGTVRTGGTGTWRFEQRVSEVKRYTAEQEQIARNVLAEVKGEAVGEADRSLAGAAIRE